MVLALNQPQNAGVSIDKDYNSNYTHIRHFMLVGQNTGGDIHTHVWFTNKLR